MDESQSDAHFDPSKYDFRGLAWRSVVVIIFSTIAASIFFGLIFNFIALESSLTVLGFTTFFGILIPTIVIVRHSPFTYIAALRLNPFDIKLFGVGFLGLLVCFGLEIGSQAIFYRLMPDTFESVNNWYSSSLFTEIEKLTKNGIFSPQFFIAVFFVAVLPAVGEEFFFRGLFLKTLEYMKTPLVAVTISTIVFTILHVNPFSLLPIFVLGFLLGVIAISTGSIYPSMIFHFLFNFASVLALFIDPGSALVTSNENLPELHYAVLLLLVSLGAIFYIIKYLFANRTNSAVSNYQN